MRKSALFLSAFLGLAAMLSVGDFYRQKIVLAASEQPQRIILVHGHRGSRATRPENTLSAFQFALKNGADVLELDLAVTKDNQLVVSHSPYLVQPQQLSGWHERICKGPEMSPITPIHFMTLEQVEQFDCGTANPAFPHQLGVPGTKVATFDQVLDLMATDKKIQLNVETKSFPVHPELTPAPADFVRLIVDAIHRHHADESRIILQSFDFRTLAEMRKQDPAIRLSALIGNPNGDTLMGLTDHNKDFVHVHEITGAEIISPEQSLVTPEAVAAAHRVHMQVVPWTVDNAEDWKRMADDGVDAIISDDPVALLAWLRAQQPTLHN